MFCNVRMSLSDITGCDYTEKAAAAAAALGGIGYDEAIKIANEKVDFYPETEQRRNDALLDRVGAVLLPPFENSNDGAPTDSFRLATHKAAAPLSGFGCFRVGEDGKLYLLGKSEHYHTSLGHSFGGYRLVDNARRLGIPNATHNNTRGYITRLCERRIIQSINGIDWEDDTKTDEIIASDKPKVLNRVINLETGSLAVEAGVKMMLARFYRLSPEFPEPKYSGRIPVFLVVADHAGEKTGNYHGTTVLTQTFRGLWGEFYEAAEAAGLYKVVSVKINNISDFAEKVNKYNSGRYKTAGFLHEIILMNYGGIRLTAGYLQDAYRLCGQTDTPVLVDEIQSCMWYGGMFLFRKYGLNPDFVALGKGFPGGEYPASRIVTTAEYDNLNQFGALVTNGQEELASLSYLITMAFARANTGEIDRLGSRFFEGLTRLKEKHPSKIVAVEGLGHLAALHFKTTGEAAGFANALNASCVDASAQLYKPNCLPAVLFKPPIIASDAVIDRLLEIIDGLLEKA
ncbi:MAG: aminotransferase class III-fold pyridoxal phosphate-dependent enzyme [Clostridiales bacterium]|nr:aminotransferase class III-fold pyridoxal phosphate-dependent enzyme [Clostridiales bacterium]